MRPGSCANRYGYERLAGNEGYTNRTDAAVAGGVLGEVRGDRAGRTPGSASSADQNLTARASLAIELWIGTLSRVPPWSVRRSIRWN